MEFDLLLRRARLADAEALTDIGVTGGVIAAIAPDLGNAAGEVVDAGGCLVAPGFIETHIHLDKSGIIDRCGCAPGRNPHRAMERVSAVKHTFTVEDVNARARATIEKAISHGTMTMRTHAEVDPLVGLRGFQGVKALVDAYKWAIDLEICVMPQEGLLDSPGTEELMVEALKSGATVIGAAPNYDRDRAGQIRRVFELAQEFDVDVDMHLDSGFDPNDLDLRLVCEITDRIGWGGRVAFGHGTKIASATPEHQDRIGKMMADSGVALAVLPATDLFLMGRDQDHNIRRGVVDAHRLMAQGALCNLSTNNVQNPFTPFGDAQLIRMANLYANVVQRGDADELRKTWDMFTANSAKVLRLKQYGIAVGNPADLVVVDAPDPVAALRGISPVLMGFKRGRRSFSRARAELHPPG
ncbi:amidohydrolase family protein [Roseococcus sp. SDR]|uniref:amidohydrolase family protein n=1 Tax=Roseococcus sp. SDR TaxID=2835532 RepID=UPI001BD185DB|nr:amidohydrolase family protein [Roseococcus sp. SDR]MBS7792126.1 amidohydrolase family protein [Roseococcus sp. SDR]MBV1847440.1 amidohydrolase family protein [Roseococcus sp. SDR]